jgi:GNAT superfamily N-acetyltransferase
MDRQPARQRMCEARRVDPAAVLLVQAICDDQAGWISDVAWATGGDHGERDGVRWAWKAHDRALHVLFPEAPSPAALDRIVALGEARGARELACWSSGLADDRDLDALLLERGFERGWRPRWMALALEGANLGAPDARVHQEDTVPEWDGFGRMLLRMRAADPPLARVFTARTAEGRLAGFAWLHTGGPPGPVAGMFDVIVFDLDRRQGLGRALVLAACRTARELGVRHVTLNATPDGELLYASCGFGVLGDGRTWWRHR